MAADRDGPDRPEGITRRQLFRGLGGGAISVGLLGGAARGEPGPAVEAGDAGAAVLGPGPVRMTFTLNGSARSVEVEPRTSLLELLREGFDLTGAKPACERGACGACTVLVDGLAIDACMMLALDAWGRAVTTVEGLERGGQLSPLQRAFVEHDALQCGFCTPGMLMSCTALLASRSQPTLDQIKRAVAGNLCRCGAHPRVLSATQAVAAASALPPRPPGRKEGNKEADKDRP